MLGHHRHASLSNLTSERSAPLLGPCAYDKDVTGPTFATVSTKNTVKKVKLSLHTKIASDCCAYTKTQSIYGKVSKLQGDAVPLDDSDNDLVPDLTNSPTSSDSLSLPDFDDFKGSVNCPEITSENEDTSIAYGALVGLGSRQPPKRRAVFTLADDQDVEEEEESTREGECEGDVQTTGAALRRQTISKEASLGLNKWFKQGRV